VTDTAPVPGMGVAARPAAATGWESTTSTAIVPTEGGAVGVAVREESELKAAIVLARSFPRDEPAAYARLMKSCARPGFAEGAEYSFPRGGQNVTGPSVDLAREAARCWGNIRYGLRIVSEDEDRVHIKGYAHDCETNNMVEMEDKFAKLIQRRRKGGTGTDWVKPDERDLRELVNRRGAILVRNCLLQVLPPDVIEDARAKTRETLHRAARGEIEQDRDAAIRRLALAFEQFGVGTTVLAQYLGHDLQAITAEELAELRKVWKSMADGQSRREDHFDIPRAGEKVSALNEALREASQAGSATAEEAPAAEPPAAVAVAPETKAQSAAPPAGLAAFVALVLDTRADGRAPVADDAQRERLGGVAKALGAAGEAEAGNHLLELAADEKLSKAQASRLLLRAREAGIGEEGANG
jgi:hypothetical protein